MSDSSCTLLATFAHPDDESFGPGGTLARYASQGVSVHLACATRGEVGEVDEALLAGYADLAELRSHELACAAGILGLAGVHYLGYRDSGMVGSPDNEHPNALAAAPLDEVAGKIVGLIRELQPQVVITFDPFGGYGHPDHIKIHNATVAAFHTAADPGAYPEQIAGGLAPWQPQKLYFSTMPRQIMRLMVRIMPLLGRDPTAFGVNHDINLKQIAEWEQPVSARVDVSCCLEAKQAAGACHRSQTGPAGLYERLPRWVVRRMMSTETFYRAYPAADGREKDLFEGVSCGQGDRMPGSRHPELVRSPQKP